MSMRFAWRALGLLVACLASGAALAAPVPADWDPSRDTALADWRWSAAQQFHWPRAQLMVRQFRAPLPPAQAAARLSRAAGSRLTRLQFSAGAWFLSGTDRRRHWLVQLRAQGRGTIGQVSRLAPALRPWRFDPARLAPGGARRVFQLADGASADAVSWASFDCPGTLRQVRASVHRALRAHGWRPDAGDASAAWAAEWRHPREGALTVALVARPASIALTFWHRPKEPS
ncbi:hypothetical protein ACMHYJ_03475 [Castellaniella hirudinis]|uniref:hypothetical protein n=1 Tax=Castellaniella hirudinis TaxID=1144617 RepID=UPI0039C398E6